MISKSLPQHWNSGFKKLKIPLSKLEFEFFILKFKFSYISKKLNHEQKHHLNQSGNRTQNKTYRLSDI